MQPKQGPTPSRRTTLRRALGTLAAAWVAASAPARLARSAVQPARLRVLCGAPPGGIPDLIARRYADALTPLFAGGTWVDNRPGAGGLLAIRQLMQSGPEAATLLLAHGGIATMYPALYTKLPYDPATDLAPVSIAAETAFGLAVGPGVPASVQGASALLAQMRLDPALANYGSPGPGTLPHVLGAMLTGAAGVAATHVPYAGGPPALVDLMGGRLAAMFLPEGLLRQHHAAGRLRVLAATGADGARFMTEVPTFASQGLPAMMVSEWFAFFMPGPTPAAAVGEMAAAIHAAAASAALAAAMSDLAMRPASSTPSALIERISAERGPWRAAIQSAGIRLQ